MCIVNNPEMLKKEKAKTGRLMLWKVIRGNDGIGIWRNTVQRAIRKFSVGENIAVNYYAQSRQYPGQFYCCFTRKAARYYRQFRDCEIYKLKIIKVYAHREDIVQVGIDKFANGMPSISLLKMEIKS